jgi:hypothetical protein
MKEINFKVNTVFCILVVIFLCACDKSVDLKREITPIGKDKARPFKSSLISNSGKLLIYDLKKSGFRPYYHQANETEEIVCFYRSQGECQACVSEVIIVKFESKSKYIDYEPKYASRVIKFGSQGLPPETSIENLGNENVVFFRQSSMVHGEYSEKITGWILNKGEFEEILTLENDHPGDLMQIYPVKDSENGLFDIVVKYKYPSNEVKHKEVLYRYNNKVYVGVDL